MKMDFTAQEFRARLGALGLALDDKAFAAAFAGAQHLRGEVARMQAYLARPE
jgi:hypothetical protein